MLALVVRAGWPSEAQATGQLFRVAGSNRIQTAIDISQRLYPLADSAGAVVLARSDDFADALTAAALAGLVEAPILLTPSGRALDSDVHAEIDRILTAGKTIFIVGGPQALSAQIDQTLVGAYGIERLAGNNRYDTARLVTLRADEARGMPADSAIIASGQNFPDALAASSYAAFSGTPIVLVKKDTIPAESQAVLTPALTSAFVIGGSAAVTDQVVTDIEARIQNLVTRIAGADRYETSTRVAGFFFATPLAVTVATGMAFPDALAGGMLAGSTILSPAGTPLVLTKSSNVPASVSTYLTSNQASIDDTTSGFILGGTSAVSLETEFALEKLL